MVRPSTRRRQRRPDPRRAGFTLTELLVVVAIIATTAALAGPAMYGAFAEQKTNQASIELVRLIQRARAEAGAYGRAHLVRFDGTGDGVFTVYRGSISSCQANLWDAAAPNGIIAAGACGTATTMCVDQLDLVTAGGTYNWGNLDVRAIDDVGGLDTIDICYEPSGRVVHRTNPAVPFSDRNTVAGGYRFRFDRYESGVLTGVSRRVVIPLGGDARIVR